MRNLNVPSIDALVYYDKISNEKRGRISERLVRLQKRIAVAYTLYTANSNALQTVIAAGITGVREKALLHAYDFPTKSMRVMRGKLLAPGLEDFDECPYCGINEPKTLDHYLPKDKYPEFSVFPKNLVPICHVCNTKYKGSQFLSTTGDRLFLHTYYDQFPTYNFISVDVSVSDQIDLKFCSRADPSNVAFSLLFANHFNTLALNERFVTKSAAEISRKRSSLRRLYGTNNYRKVSRELQLEASDLRKTLSGNHWKVALYEGLAASRDFCDGGFLKVVKKDA